MDNSSKSILILGLNFYPELVGIGHYTGEMARYLAGQGHDVHVITTPPYYPAWRIAQSYSGWRYQHETRQGLQVYRCPLWVPRKPTGLKRLLHLFSFALSSFPILLGQLRWKPDIVMCIAPAFFCAPFALLTARLSGAKSWLHIQDFELDAATNLGMLSADHFLVRWLAGWESWLLKRFDRVSTISNRMMDRLLQKGVSSERIFLFPNWVDTKAIFPLPETTDTLRKELGIPEEKIVVLYSGSMGAKQGLETVVAAAQRLQPYADIAFVFCGEGPGRDDLIEATQHLSNVKHISLQPIEKLNLLLNTADIHILPQRASVADLVMPSKLLGMLASGKPVIACASPETEIGQVIRQVGVLASPDDYFGYDNAILALVKSPSERQLLGARGRSYVCETWDAEIVLTRFQQQLEMLIEN